MTTKISEELKKHEKIYTIIVSVFFGILIVLLLDRLFTKPRIIHIYSDNLKEKFNNINKKNINCNCFNNKI
jgi:hypothetical protein